MPAKRKKSTVGGARPGAGRKPLYDEPLKQIGQAPASLVDALGRRAKKNGESRAQLVIRLLRDGLRREK